MVSKQAGGKGGKEKNTKETLADEKKMFGSKNLEAE